MCCLRSLYRRNGHAVQAGAQTKRKNATNGGARIRASRGPHRTRPAPARFRLDSPAPLVHWSLLVTDSAAKSREFFIHGVTAAGRPFRPSDWAERLCGVMSCYRPGGVASGRDALIGYSPLVRPMLIGGVKCVVVDERLKEIEPMAFHFVFGFARDNELPVYEGCTLPDPDA